MGLSFSLLGLSVRVERKQKLKTDRERERSAMNTSVRAVLSSMKAPSKHDTTHHQVAFFFSLSHITFSTFINSILIAFLFGEIFLGGLCLVSDKKFVPLD
jgi:hypothetical protein